MITSRPPFAGHDGGSGASDRNELVASLIGRRLDHFEIEAFVGGGGMGAVFRALDTRLNRPVALKVLSVSENTDEALCRRFRNEAQSAARLDHENIARVFYVGSDLGYHYIAFEYIEGINIRDLVARDGPLPLSAAASYVLQVAEALAHACSRDVVHRDIKPSNVLLTDAGQIKLVDMGLARLDDARESREDLTVSGVTLGTFDYISPEQARDPRHADVRSDIYSLGCTFYFMLTGRPPFPDGTVLQKLLQHQADSPADPREYNPSIPEPICGVLAKMLAKNPADRYQHPQDLIADMLLVAGELALDLSAPANTIVVTTSTPLRSRWEQHLPWAAPIVALLLIVGALELFSRYESARLDVPTDEAVPPPSLGKVDPQTFSSANRLSSSSDATVEADQAPDRNHVASRPSSQRPPEFDDPPPVYPGDAGTAVDEAGTDTDGTAGGGPSRESPPTMRSNSDTTTPPRPETAVAAPSTKASAPPATTDSRDARRVTHTTTPSSPEPPGIATDDSVPPLPVGLAQSARSDVAPAQKRRDTTGDTTVAAESGVEASPASPDKVSVTDATGESLESASGAGTEGANDVSVSAPLPDGVLIVDDEGGPHHYSTLADACAAARSGNVIELRYDGRRTERPIELANKDLTIRGGPGFQPQIEFRPDWNDTFSLPVGCSPWLEDG
ncbi:MAG: protein kinase [Pirellulales bacterium]